MFDKKILTHGLCTPFRQVEWNGFNLISGKNRMYSVICLDMHYFVLGLFAFIWYNDKFT